MRIDLQFDVLHHDEIRIPRVNLHLLQAMVYSLMPGDLAHFLHEKGYETGKRKFKLFCYSWLKGKTRPRFDKRFVYFTPPLELTVTSPIPEIIEGFTTFAPSKDCIRLGNNELRCSGVLLSKTKRDSGSVTVKTISPITCFSTLYGYDGSPYTVYHSPQEEIFQRQIYDNLIKKFRLIYPDQRIPDDLFKFEICNIPRQQVALFKKGDPRPIKGWWGHFKLQGPKELLQVALDAGLGAKNSAGFGCVIDDAEETA